MVVAPRVRAALTWAALLVGAQAAGTLLLAGRPVAAFVSDLIQAVAAVLAAVQVTAAARRSAGYARRFWALIGASLWLWLVAQLAYSYDDAWLGIAPPQPSVVHLLFRLYGAPLVMVLLLRGDESPGVDWQRALDFAQVGIVFLFFYFDLYFVPGGEWHGLTQINLFGFLDLSDLENWLLVLAFGLRSLRRPPDPGRSLAARWTPFLVAYALTSSLYNYAYTFQNPSSGSWYDLPWVATLALGVLLASGWAPGAGNEDRNDTAADGSTGTGWLPALMPLITIVLALQLARRELLVAFAAVFGSVACFGVRLLLTQARQERAMAALRGSERRQRELVQDLEAKNTELERFTFTVSHDLRSPLITILGFLGFVEKAVDAGKSAEARSDLARIRSAATRMERLLRELLDLSRIGRVKAPAQPVAVETLATEAVATAQAAIARGGVEVRIEPGLPTVYGDPVRLRQLVQNLLDNAVSFVTGCPQPAVTIGSQGTEGDGWHRLFVRDNGVGIDPRHHQRIFGLFEKLSAGGEGTGVGLAIVKRVVELHGGRVWVDSTPGQGATFWFTLPGRPPAPASA